MENQHVMIGFVSSAELILLGALFLPGAISAIPAYIILSRVPPRFRRLHPRQALYLLIPLLWLVANFLVHPKVARSVGDFARDRGQTDFGDGGASLARLFSICVLAGLLRYVGLLFLVVGYVLLAVLYTRLFSMCARLSQSALPGADSFADPAKPVGGSSLKEDDLRRPS